MATSSAKLKLPSGPSRHVYDVIVLGSQLGYGLAFGTIGKRLSFETYVSRLHDRPAYKRATALDDATMPKLGTAA